MKTMDIEAELKFCGEFAQGVGCSIDSCLWRVKTDWTRGMTCVSHVPEAAREFCTHPSDPWTGKTMLCTVGQKPMELFVERGFFTGVHASGEGNAIPETEAHLFEFRTGNPMPVSGKFRAVVFVEGLRAPLFQECFEKAGDGGEKFCISVDFPPAHFVWNGIEFNFHNCRYLVCTRSDATGQSRHQLVVEALGKIDYNSFCADVRQILCVIGFFTGSYCFGPFWIFDADTHEFLAYNDCMGKPCSARYRLTSLNPWDYFTKMDQCPKKVQTMTTQLKPISQGHFERLLELLDKAKFSDVFYVFQDLNSRSAVASPAIRLVAYAACLEMCARWWSANKSKGKKGGDLTALFSPESREKAKAEMERILKAHFSGDSDWPIVQKKLENFFALPNQDLLTRAFEHTGALLSEDDKQLLSWRNPLLHGDNIMKQVFNTANPMPYVEDAEEKCFRFHALIWRFLMLSIGYDGQYIDCQKLEKLFRSSKSNGGRPLIRDVRTGKELL